MTDRTEFNPLPEFDPENCASMAELRDVIDRLDAALVALLRQRQDCIDRAAILKQSENLPARIPERVREVLDKVRAEATASGLDADLSEALWREMIEWAIAREERVLDARSQSTAPKE